MTEHRSLREPAAAAQCRSALDGQANTPGTDAASALAPVRRSAGASVLALVAASGTLVCCVLPAVMVSLGAGATLAALVRAVPQLIWLSAHKGLVFTIAAALLALGGAMLVIARRAPCPADPMLARACARLRTLSWVTYSVAVVATAAGAVFAFAWA